MEPPLGRSAHSDRDLVCLEPGEGWGGVSEPRIGIIYIYIYVYLLLSLSLSIYIYIHMYNDPHDVVKDPEPKSQTLTRLFAYLPAAAGAVKELKARRSVQRWKAPFFSTRFWGFEVFLNYSRKVWGSGFGVWGLGFGVGVQFGLGVLGLGSGFSCLVL